MRAVHFAPGDDPLRAACGRSGSFPLVLAPTPEHVTCRGRCAVAARKATEELRALALRAVDTRIVFLDFDGVLNHGAFYTGELAEERAAAKAAQSWLDALPAPPTAFVVLDDDGGLWMDPVGEHLVQTAWDGGGLTVEKAAEALLMLGVCPCWGEADDPGPHIAACRWGDPEHQEGAPL